MLYGCKVYVSCMYHTLAEEAVAKVCCMYVMCILYTCKLCVAFWGDDCVCKLYVWLFGDGFNTRAYLYLLQILLLQ